MSKFGSEKTRKRIKRKGTIRKRITGTAERPRLSRVPLGEARLRAGDRRHHGPRARGGLGPRAETLKTGSRASRRRSARAQIGKAIGEKLVAQKITAVVFDRNGFIYHGRVKEVADGAREAGLQF